MRFALLLYTLFALQATAWPVPVRAEISSDCSVSIDAFAKDLETNTIVVDDLASPSHPSPDHVAQSAARYNRDVDSSKLCPTSKKAYVEALLTTWRAWIEHATTHAPTATVELAEQELEKCAVAYSGTGYGATCATWEKQVIKWQGEWAD